MPPLRIMTYNAQFYSSVFRPDMEDDSEERAARIVKAIQDLPPDEQPDVIAFNEVFTDRIMLHLPIIGPVLRKIIWRLPSRLQPKVQPEVWVVGFDADDGTAVDGVRTDQPGFGGVTGVVEHDGRLWMSTIEFSALGYVEL